MRDTAGHGHGLNEILGSRWDIVVIGGGNAGLTAAISARHLVDRVLLLERSPIEFRGGNTRHARNIRCVHRTAGAYNTGRYLYDELWSDLCTVEAGPSNEELAALTVSESESIPKWMSDHGVRWQPLTSGARRLGRTNRLLLGGGKALVNAYHSTLAKMGVTVLYDAFVDALVIEGDTCTAVIVNIAGRGYKVEARAVVCASGGFEANLEWLHEYWGDAAENYSIRGTEYNDGTLLKDLYAHGAAPAGQAKSFHAVPVDARSPRFDGGIATRIDTIPFGILVNRAGQRFCDEGEVLPKRYAIWGRKLAEQPGQTAYSIWDAKVNAQFRPPMYGPVEATSISELARTLGLDEQAFEKAECCRPPVLPELRRSEGEPLPANRIERQRGHVVHEIGTTPIGGNAATVLSHQDNRLPKLSLERRTHLLTPRLGTLNGRLDDYDPPVDEPALASSVTEMSTFEVHEHMFARGSDEVGAALAPRPARQRPRSRVAVDASPLAAASGALLAVRLARSLPSQPPRRAPMTGLPRPEWRVVGRYRQNGSVPVRADVRPELLAWARERSRIDADDLVHRFPKLPEWEQGVRAPTLKQLESFAHATHTPVGFLFLPEPPDEPVPIPDFRTIADAGVRRPSADLLDTIFLCQQRQEWYRDFAQVTREDPVDAVASLTLETSVGDAAQAMRAALAFEDWQRGATWSEGLRVLIERAEDIGVMVMVSGVVGSNTHRKLDPHEFRGFALVDRLAPLVFINGADTKAAQIFTLAHELAHLWLGETALSSADLVSVPTVAAERWCNQVAAEFLVPVAALAGGYDAEQPLVGELERLTRRFKVSTLVVLRRLHDAGYLNRDAYRAAYRGELDRILAILEERGGAGGGNFYNTQPVRVSKRFARAVITSTLEGQTLHRDAYQLLGFKKHSTFQELASRLGAD